MIQCALALMLFAIFSTPIVTIVTTLIMSLDNVIQDVQTIQTVLVEQYAMVTIYV